MTAYDSARYYMLGVVLCYLQLVVTVLSDRPWRWLELAASWAVVWPLLGAWRREA